MEICILRKRGKRRIVENRVIGRGLSWLKVDSERTWAYEGEKVDILEKRMGQVEIRGN